MLGRSFTVGMVSRRKTAFLAGQGKSGKGQNNSNNTRIIRKENNNNSGVGFRGVHLGLKFRSEHNSQDLCADYGAMRLSGTTLRSLNPKKKHGIP